VDVASREGIEGLVSRARAGFGQIDVLANNAGSIRLKDAVRMASKTPADILGLFEKGKITPGADADLVVLSTEGMGEATIVAGETVYDGRGESHVR
jgi:alpha-D-ribose 1-methylphosphonate 5-triphosphate diphosphatase PhnM